MNTLLVVDLKSMDVNCGEGFKAESQRVGNTLIIQLSERKAQVRAAVDTVGFVKITEEFRKKAMAIENRSAFLTRVGVPIHALSEIANQKTMKAANYKPIADALGIKSKGGA